MIKGRRFHGNMIHTKQFVRRFYGDMKNKEISVITKKIDKKKDIYRDRVLNLSQKLDFRLSSHLFHTQIYPKVREIKQAILHQKVLVNNRIIGGYNYNIDLYDDVKEPKYFYERKLVLRYIFFRFLCYKFFRII